MYMTKKMVFDVLPIMPHGWAVHHFGELAAVIYTPFFIFRPTRRHLTS
jgi:hypothetical protein